MHIMPTMITTDSGYMKSAKDRSVTLYLLSNHLHSSSVSVHAFMLSLRETASKSSSLDKLTTDWSAVEIPGKELEN